MDKKLIEKNELEIDHEDLGISTALDQDFDNLVNAAQVSQTLRKRFVLVCDATSSMGTWWDAAQKALKQAVDEISSRTNTPFQVKVVAYRDHSCDDIPVEESDWSNNTDYLKEFIAQIKSTGGGDFPESIGHGLRPALQSGAQLVVLIGDAPGRRNSQGFVEAKQLGEAKCPIYALYAGQDVRTVEAFQQIAFLSGGKALYLKNTDSMSDIFAALLAKIVFQISYQATTIEGKILSE